MDINHNYCSCFSCSRFSAHSRRKMSLPAEDVDGTAQDSDDLFNEDALEGLLEVTSHNVQVISRIDDKEETNAVNVDQEDSIAKRGRTESISQTSQLTTSSSGNNLCLFHEKDVKRRTKTSKIWGFYNTFAIVVNKSNEDIEPRGKFLLSVKL